MNLELFLSIIEEHEFIFFYLFRSSRMEDVNLPISKKTLRIEKFSFYQWLRKDLNLRFFVY